MLLGVSGRTALAHLRALRACFVSFVVGFSRPPNPEHIPTPLIPRVAHPFAQRRVGLLATGGRAHPGPTHSNLTNFFTYDILLARSIAYCY